MNIDLETLENVQKEINYLKQENQELKLENTILKEDSNYYRDKYLSDYDGLLQENTKLKKVLKILKEEPYILEIGLENFTYDKFDNTYYYEEESYIYEDLDFRNEIYVISKENYDLLKEILLCQKD